MRDSHQLLLLLSLALIISFHFSAVQAGTEQRVEIGPRHEELFFDFGHLGIDFPVHHTFYLVNRTKEAFRIIKAIPSCDCTKVSSLDSIVEPGDTAFFRLKFNSKDFYGPTSKSFTVSTDHPLLPKVQFFFLSQVGQWFHGIKPDPISLFFLPSQKSRKITVKNTEFDKISLRVREQFDSSFVVTIVKDRAKRGQALELEITPREDLAQGTYSSNFTLAVEKKGVADPTILTIPIKIVRY